MKKLCGYEMDKISNLAFRIMSLEFKLTGFARPTDNYITEFGIKPGSVIIDYGCGPGRFIRKASELVGPDGTVYAVDIHELAIKAVNKIINKYGLRNVSPLVTNGYSVDIPDNSADLIYALDMFHMIKDTKSFLTELHRIVKKDGISIIEDGHQPRESAKMKIQKTELWVIFEENEKYMKCNPKK
jgi:ubiquinone/menaquinone biosynthesis C-methylase UbiE